MHICVEYPNGVGHIEVREGRFMVSFYRGRGRVAQSFHDTLQSARFALRRIASV